MSQTPVKQIKTARVDSLDYLRGLAAFGIMAYHMYLFNFSEVDSSSFLAKIKIYGVSIFYILSGLTLYLVYANKLSLTKKSLTSFYVKRIFRIVPLLWLASLLTLIIHYNYKEFSYNKLFVNITVIPGIVRPASFFANGAWSIGNELFFYAIFPLLIYIAHIHKKYLYATLLISFLAIVLFATKLLNPSIPLGMQWSVYVNPLGQVFFFVAGMSLAAIDSNKIQRKKLYAVVCAALMLAIYLFPVTGEPIKLITGIERILLSLLTTLLCFYFYKTDFDFLPTIIKKSLKTLGEISYSLYLIHPIIFDLLFWGAGKMGAAPSPYFLIPSTIMLSLILSYFNYQYFEKFFINKGNELLGKINAKSQLATVTTPNEA